MKPVHHPNVDEITLPGLMAALSDPVRVQIVRSLALQGEASCGTFELGLVCTERWADYPHPARSDMHDHRQSYEEPIYQWWLPLDRNQPRTDLTLPVVPEAPFSHVGSALSFLWTVTARDRRSGFDKLERHDLTVLP